jgi:hypothetical protein
MIDTTGAWNGSSNISSFGYPDTATYGQTVTASNALGTQLNSFSFEIRLPTAVLFRGEVYAWSGTQATGPALFESAATHTTSATSFQEITFNTGGVQLTAGQQYVLFASISKDYAADVNAGQGTWGSSLTDTYSGGQFVYINNGGNSSQWTGAAWTTDYIGNGDLAFKADFSAPVAPPAVPEPASLTLVGLGAAGLMGYAWRRRKQVA